MVTRLNCCTKRKHGAVTNPKYLWREATSTLKQVASIPSQPLHFHSLDRAATLERHRSATPHRVPGILQATSPSILIDRRKQEIKLTRHPVNFKRQHNAETSDCKSQDLEAFTLHLSYTTTTIDTLRLRTLSKPGAAPCPPTWIISCKYERFTPGHSPNVYCSVWIALYSRLLSRDLAIPA